MLGSDYNIIIFHDGHVKLGNHGAINSCHVLGQKPGDTRV